MTQEELINKFIDHMKNHQTLQLAITEAVHRFLYDHCFNPHTGKMYDSAQVFSDLHQTLYCENPNWRYLLKKKLERYNGWDDTTSISISGKPKQIIKLLPTFEIDAYGDKKEP